MKKKCFRDVEELYLGALNISNYRTFRHFANYFQVLYHEIYLKFLQGALHTHTFKDYSRYSTYKYIINYLHVKHFTYMHMKTVT